MLTRILKIGAGVAAVAAAGGLIYHFRLWERDWSHIDDGWANLIGSAIGAFLAVIGALYVSKTEERRKKKAFEEFVKVAVQNVVVQASYLEAMAREPHRIGPTPEVQLSIISIQQRTLLDALAVFDREIAHSKDGDYQLRRSIISLDSMLGETRNALVADGAPSQILHNWHIGAYQVRTYATTALQARGWMVVIPTPNLIAKKAEEAILTWKSWNIPIHNGSVSATDTIGNIIQQPLNHVAA